MADAAAVPKPEEIYDDIDIKPRQGILIPLKTKAELEAEDVTVDVYVVEIPLKSANSILNLLQDAIPGKDNINLQHLRRFAKPAFLPERLRNSALASFGNGPTQLDEQVKDTTLMLHLLICPTSLISSAVIKEVLKNFAPFKEAAFMPHVFTIPVPLHPPTSEEQAKRWSLQYWPTVYKRSNPYGPHPSLVARAEDELREQAGVWMALAELAAAQVTIKGAGKSVGVVIVDKGSAKGPSAVAVAGDARWCSPKDAIGHIEGSGNVLAHAVMRAIGMIAQERLRLSENGMAALNGMDKGEPAASEADIFLDEPMTPVEHRYYNNGSLAPGGYLCLDLDIYITHEPCVMCSMAILHSRFGRVVFGRGMPQTGGLTANQYTKVHSAQPEDQACTEDGRATDPNIAFNNSTGLGYGLFWRLELNWKLLAWQWKDAVWRWPDRIDENIHI
ncbi:MAG: tRNA-specific adenosine deaminase subunit tad3 [Candelina submexicana]|nr:MAG: tRNA-specific adenosine deaminase subunit tad3 [Candelina submexicana]